MKRWVTLFFLLSVPSVCNAQDGEVDSAPLSFKLVAKRTEYPWEAWDKVKNLGRIRVPPVCLVVELTNRAKHKLEIIGAPEPGLTLSSPDREDVKPIELDRFFVAPRRIWEIAPGSTIRFVVPELAYHEGTTRKGFILPTPGKYTLRAEFTVGVSPAPKGAPPFDPGDRGKDGRDWGMLKLTTDPIKLIVNKGSVADYWIKALDDPDADVRIAALHAVKHLGEEAKGALSSLVSLLKDPNAATRILALEAIHSLGTNGKDGLNNIVLLLRDTNPEVRAAAVKTLRAIAPKDAKARLALIPLLRDLEVSVRRVTAEEMRSLLYQNRPVEPELKAALLQTLTDDSDSGVRAHLLHAFHYLPEPDVLKAVLPFAASANPPEWSYALGALGEISRQLPAGKDRPLVRAAVKEMIQALKDAAKRETAAFWLQYMMPEAKDALPTLMWALEDPESFPKSVNSIRVNLCRTLGAIGPDAQPAGPLLVKVMLKDEEWQVRTFAATALGKLERAATKHVPDLAQALKDKMDQVRSAAAESLGTLGPIAGEAVPHLIHLLQTEPSTKTKTSAAFALHQIGMKGRKSAVPALVDALSDPEVGVVINCVIALGQIGPDARDALPSLRRLLKDARITDRAHIQNAIKAIDPS